MTSLTYLALKMLAGNPDMELFLLGLTTARDDV